MYYETRNAWISIFLIIVIIVFIAWSQCGCIQSVKPNMDPVLKSQQKMNEDLEQKIRTDMEIQNKLTAEKLNSFLTTINNTLNTSLSLMASMSNSNQLSLQMTQPEQGIGFWDIIWCVIIVAIMVAVFVVLKGLWKAKGLSIFGDS